MHGYYQKLEHKLRNSKQAPSNRGKGNWQSKRVLLTFIPTREIVTPCISIVNNQGIHLKVEENPLAFACREPRWCPRTNPQQRNKWLLQQIGFPQLQSLPHKQDCPCELNLTDPLTNISQLGVGIPVFVLYLWMYTDLQIQTRSKQMLTKKMPWYEPDRINFTYSHSTFSTITVKYHYNSKVTKVFLSY